jgi:hypothetical protein
MTSAESRPAAPSKAALTSTMRPSGPAIATASPVLLMT